MARDSKHSIWYLAVGFSLFVSISGCKPKDDIVLRSIKEIVLEAEVEPMLRAKAVLYNPNAMHGKLRKIELDVFVNGKKSGRIDQELKIAIPAKAEFIVPLEVKLNMKELGLLDTLLGMIGGRKLKVEYRGSIRVTYKGLPIRLPVDHQSDVRLKF